MSAAAVSEAALRVEAADGVVLHAEARGEGPTVLLTPGFSQTCESFRPQVAPLVGAGFRVVLWELRGHGRSGAPAEDAGWSMARIVDDLGRVLDRTAPGRRAVVGGLSFGGLAAMHFALAHPERVRGLVLLASGPGFKSERSQAAWADQVERTARRLEERGMEALLQGRAAHTTIGGRPELPAARAAAEAFRAQDPRAVAAFGRKVAAAAPPVIGRLHELTAPALVLVGEEDEPYRRAAEVMRSRIPDARPVVVPGAGHVVSLEASEAVSRELLAFLESLPAEAGG